MGTTKLKSGECRRECDLLGCGRPADFAILYDRGPLALCWKHGLDRRLLGCEVIPVVLDAAAGVGRIVGEDVRRRAMCPECHRPFYLHPRPGPDSVNAVACDGSVRRMVLPEHNPQTAGGNPDAP